MYKRAFIILLTLNLFFFAAVGLWIGNFPNQALKAQSGVSSGSSPSTVIASAPVDVSIGDVAINAYLQYAVTDQPDLNRFLQSATVTFHDTWTCSMGLKLVDRVVPFTMDISPHIDNGNLTLQVESAHVGGIPVPVSLLFVLLRHVHFPAWTSLDESTRSIHLFFTERPQHPYGVRVLDYAPSTRLLTLQVTILPKTLRAAA